MLSSVEDGCAVGNARCVERCRRILRWSVRTLESARLTIASQGLVCWRPSRNSPSGGLAVATKALGRQRRSRCPASGRLT